MTASPTLPAWLAAQQSDNVSASPGGGAGGQQAGDEVPGPLDPAPPSARPEEQPERCRNAAELRGHRVPNRLVLEPREDGRKLFLTKSFGAFLKADVQLLKKKTTKKHFPT